MDRVGGDGHRAHCLFVALMPHVEHGVALAGANLEFVVHLRHERANRVDDGATGRACGLNDLGRRAVGTQHDRCAGWHQGHVVDEDDAK